jgi:hypothetical protein
MTSTVADSNNTTPPAELDNAATAAMPAVDPRLAQMQAAQARALLRRRIKASQNGVLAAATMMMVGGWGGLYVLVVAVPPLALYRWLFFILLYMAVTGTVLPFVWYLNRLFGGNRLVMGGTILREGIWFGLFAITLAWLQLIRNLNIILAIIIGAALLAIEIFLRLRERQGSSTG